MGTARATADLRTDGGTARTSLLISDWAGHPFTYELADALNRQDEAAAYSYCAATLTPKARFSGELQAISVGSGWRFEKYRPVARLISEVRYGVGLARVVWRTKPSTHVVCNMPLVSGAVAWLLSLPLRLQLVVWLQDVQSGLASSSVGDGLAGRILSELETFLLRRANRVIAISVELGEEAERRGVDPDRIGVMENWAPIEQLPVLARNDEWLAGAGVSVRRPVFLYSGTLGRKHDPSLLVDLARSLAGSGGQVIVVSEGEGADALRSCTAADDRLDNLTILPYQPFDQLPHALASADVLVVILEPSAAQFSVPSKTLSYLCAGRPILASIPPDNPAARLVAQRALAGLVAPPDDRSQFVEGAQTLASDEDLRTALGSSGRGFAEEHFAEKRVVRLFLDQIQQVEPRTTPPERGG